MLEDIHFAVLDPKSGLVSRVDWIINGVTVNGDDGSKPVRGLQNIFDAHHKNDKVQNRAIEELKQITVPLATKKKFWESVDALKANVPMVRFLLTPTKSKLAVTAFAILLFLQVLGVIDGIEMLYKILKFL